MGALGSCSVASLAGCSSWCSCALQGLSCGVLLFMLRKRCKLRLAGSQALRESLEYLRPTGGWALPYGESMKKGPHATFMLLGWLACTARASVLRAQPPVGAHSWRPHDIHTSLVPCRPANAAHTVHQCHLCGGDFISGAHWGCPHGSAPSVFPSLACILAAGRQPGSGITGAAGTHSGGWGQADWQGGAENGPEQQRA